MTLENYVMIDARQIIAQKSPEYQNQNNVLWVQFKQPGSEWVKGVWQQSWGSPPVVWVMPVQENPWGAISLSPSHCCLQCHSRTAYGQGWVSFKHLKLNWCILYQAHSLAASLSEWLCLWLHSGLGKQSRLENDKQAHMQLVVNYSI